MRLPELSMPAPSAAEPCEIVTPVTVAVTAALSTTNTPIALSPLIVTPDVADPSIASGVFVVA